LNGIPRKPGSIRPGTGSLFDLAVTIFDGWVFGFEDDRFDYDEVRLTAYGLCHGVEIMVV